MAGYNQITLLGNTGNDAEMQFTPDGKPVAKFPLAVSKKKDGEAQWFTITVWDRLAEVCSEHLRKGQQVLVVGRVELDQWTGADSVPRSRLAVTANTVTFLGAKSGRLGQDGEPEPAGADSPPF